MSKDTFTPRTLIDELERLIEEHPEWEHAPIKYYEGSIAYRFSKIEAQSNAFGNHVELFE